MLKRFGVIVTIVTLGLLASGCTKCGPIWDDWMQGPKSCKSDRL